jgi:hypothetical protein
MRATLERERVIFAYAALHDAWSEAEQLLTRQGRIPEAERARLTAQLVLRAWLAEVEDPEPTQ